MPASEAVDGFSRKSSSKYDVASASYDASAVCGCASVSVSANAFIFRLIEAMSTTVKQNAHNFIASSADIDRDLRRLTVTRVGERTLRRCEGTQSYRARCKVPYGGLLKWRPDRLKRTTKKYLKGVLNEKGDYNCLSGSCLGAIVKRRTIEGSGSSAVGQDDKATIPYWHVVLPNQAASDG